MDQLQLNITPPAEWLPNTKGPIIISGPCGAESEEQVLQTARGIAKSGKVNIFRSGIWKPRTRPNSFEGVGDIGLPWLKKVKEETGLLTTVEVANAQHVEAALKNEVDILWIGARTTVNPFSVQEIADAVRGTDIPVMVKNPIHPDLQLWMGALERVNQAGITKLMAIHRGFHSYEKSKYRNSPKWEIAIELKRSCPNLPILCDPSHISGRTDLIFSVAQQALDMDMSGLMIEAHIRPEEALSDAFQQITPEMLGELLNQLTVRKDTCDNALFSSKLDELRKIVDEIDEELLQALGRRMDIIQQMGEYKRENNVTILQVKRWEEIIKSRLALGKSLGLQEDFIKQMLQLVHKESIREQTAVMNNLIEKLKE